MKKFTDYLKSIRILLLGTILLPLMYSQSAAQYCDASANDTWEHILYFEIGDIKNESGSSGNGYQNFSDVKTNLFMGKTYDINVKILDDGSEQMRVWIDYDQSGTFDDSEYVTLSQPGGSGSGSFTGKITIPTTAKSGETGLRARVTWNNTPIACGSQGYGEAEDYTVNLIPPIPDAEVSAMTSPVKPYLVGTYPVIVTLRSNNETAMTTCKIDWWVNNVFQGTSVWTGNIRNGQTANVNLGNYNFSYPENEVNFSPFQMKFTVRDVNNDNPDANPGNDTYQTSTVPSLNDCGAIGFFGPPEGFGAGLTPVRARVMNYAPKPLSRVTVYWKVDGVDQTPVTFTGLNIKQNQYQDLNMGTFFFYNKTPLGPFAVEVWTENPNNVADENTSNDKYVGGIGPSLTAGIYYAGGVNAHFANPAEAASYLNSSGVFGQGTVVIEVRPGTYNGQIILNNPLVNKNPIVFRSSTGRAFDVSIVNAPSTANNFVVQLRDFYNLSFENLTFQNNNSNISNAGRVFVVDNVDGLRFNKVVINGVSNAPKSVSYNLVTLNNTKNVDFLSSEFYFGSASVYNTAAMPARMNFDNNMIMNFSWYGIWSNFDYYNSSDFLISNNTLKLTGAGNPNGAIWSHNSSTIKNNTIGDIVGTGNANDALIYVSHTYPDADNTSWIEDNIITNCSNINGIGVNNASALVNKNIVVMSQSANYGCALLDFNNALGAAGNNMLMGSNIMGIDVNNSPNYYVIYNTVSVEANGIPVFRSAGVSPYTWRNIFMNKGNGVALNVATAVNVDQNILFSTGGNVLATINGVNYADMFAIKVAGLMPASSQVDVEFFSPSDPHLKVYNAALLFNSPLFNISTNWNGWYIESTDFDDEQRISYYAGIDEINLTISIERQTDGFTDCNGSTDNFLTVSSAIGYNAPMTYQWEHDGMAIPGANEPIFYFTNLRHSQAGVYRCLVSGPGKTVPVYSRPVAVYVARPTDITRQPASQKVAIGENTALSFDAHVNGKEIETAIVNDEVKVQWFKYVDEANDIPLVDNNWISGSKSNYLSFRNFRLADQGDYYAVIEGLCGTVKTKLVNVSEELIDLTVTKAPVDAALCSGNEATFEVEATTSTDFEITYKWSKDGTPLNDLAGKISGANTNKLVIADISKTDQGTYTVLVSLVGTALTESPMAMLNVTLSPEIKVQPQDATVQSGRQLLIDVIAEGDNLQYSWFKDDELLFTSEESVYVVDPVTPDDEGQYWVEVFNDCGKVVSEKITVTVTTGTTSVFEVSKAGYSLTTATPNPVSSNSVISFVVPNESNVKITLTDVTGTSNLVLTDGVYNAGTHNLNIDARALNLVSGTYYYFLESNGIRLAQRMIVVR